MQPPKVVYVSPALVLCWLTFGLAFWGCAELGHFLSFSGRQQFATFWPASGLYLAALAVSPKRHWPGYIATAIIANVLSDRLLHGRDATLIVAFATANTLEAISGAALLHLVHRRPFHAETLTDILLLVGLGAVLATTVGAAIGGAAVTEAFGAHSFWYNARVWWTADTVGVLAVAPILLTFPLAAATHSARGPKFWLEVGVVGCLVVLSSLIAFGPSATKDRPIPAYPFVVAPFLVWCGLRFGRFGTAVGVFVAGVIAIWGTTRGYGLFAQIEQAMEMKAAALQVYLAVMTVTPLLFATVIQQQNAAELRLKQNLELLAAGERRFRTLASFSPVGIFENDAEGRCLYVNQRCCELTGLTPEQMTGYGWTAAIHPDDRERVSDAAKSLIAAGGDRFEMEYRFQTPEGRVTWVSGAKVALRDGAGQIVSYIGNLVDITERRLAQEALQEAKQALERRVAERTGDLVAANEHLRLEMVERELAEERLREQQAQLAHAARLSNLGEMAAELAHELNQPLSVISNYVRGTQRRLLTGSVSLAEIEPTLEIIGKEANRAADVIRRTKDLVRKQFPPRTPLDLAAVVREALALVEHDLRDRQVQSDVQWGDSLPTCAGDAIQLQQVIVNLVLNAADALQCVPEDQRRITLTIKRQDDFLELAIADNGPGISPAARERVFEAFFSTKPEGLGLGLPISRGIIEGHGGKLWADRSVSGGACLRFTLPIWEGPHDDLDVADANRLRRGR